jgi:biotin synthase
MLKFAIIFIIKSMTTIRHNWTVEEILDIYNMPLLDLVYKAQTIHREFNDASEVQVSSLLSIKTGGCAEDCSYCPQAARYNTGIEVHKLMTVNEVSEAADKANAGAALSAGAPGPRLRRPGPVDRFDPGSE